MKRDRLASMNQYIAEQNTVQLTDLADHFGISMSTLRRDLDKLAAQNKIAKSYGCVTHASAGNDQHLLHSNNTLHFNEKKKTASLAANLIEDGDIIFVDSGSTCGLIADYIPSDRHVTIITNNLDIIIRGVSKINLDIYSMPGKLNRKNNSFTYMQDTNPYKDYNIGKIFFSCAGVDIQYGISHIEASERIIKKYALERTENRILVADSSKFGNVSPLHICELQAFRTICTDACPDEVFVSFCREHGVTLIYE